MSSEHHVFCKKRALLGWTGPAGPPRGGDSHLQAALIRQRTDLRGPQDRTAPKPCLWQKQSSYGGGPDGELPRAPSRGSTLRWSWRDLEARGIPATLSGRRSQGSGSRGASVSFCTATHGRRMSPRSTSSSQPRDNLSWSLPSDHAVSLTLKPCCVSALPHLGPAPIPNFWGR